MKQYPIVQLGNPVLREVGRTLRPEEITSQETQELMDAMIETMHHAEGIGLAAHQIGKPIMLAVVAHTDGELVICNPKIIRRSIFKEKQEEGCLSIRGVFGLVKRARNVTVEFLDRNAKQRRMKAQGLLARVFQHEIDHLNGTVYTDRATTITHGVVPKEKR